VIHLSRQVSSRRRDRNARDQILRLRTTEDLFVEVGRTLRSEGDNPRWIAQRIWRPQRFQRALSGPQVAAHQAPGILRFSGKRGKFITAAMSIDAGWLLARVHTTAVTAMLTRAFTSAGQQNVAPELEPARSRTALWATR
jgi:hypothetical protein